MAPGDEESQGRQRLTGWACGCDGVCGLAAEQEQEQEQEKEEERVDLEEPEDYVQVRPESLELTL